MGTGDRDYPTAVTRPSPNDNQAIALAIRWVSGQVRQLGGKLLVYSPGRQNQDADPALKQLCTRPDVIAETWLTINRPQWRGGPVLAAWPDEEHLGKIADDRRTAALCVVPWAEEEVAGWLRASAPEPLGTVPASVEARGTIIADPVAVAGLRTLTNSVNHANALAGSMDHRDAVAVLQTLYDGGHRLVPDDIYA